MAACPFTPRGDVEDVLRTDVPAMIYSLHDSGSLLLPRFIVDRARPLTALTRGCFAIYNWGIEVKRFKIIQFEGRILEIPVARCLLCVAFRLSLLGCLTYRLYKGTLKLFVDSSGGFERAGQALHVRIMT